MPLEASNLGFRYNSGPWIFRNLNLHLNSGQVLGLYGPSGSGKSTLARVLAGYEEPLEGNVKLDGEKLPKNVYKPVQLILQHPEKAINPRWQLGNTIKEGWLPDPQTIENFGISRQWFNRWPNELSAGELQRFCVIRALGPKTRFLIADEITTMLDAITQAQIWKAVMNMAKERNLGLIIVSHDKNLLDHLCKRIINLEK